MQSRLTICLVNALLSLIILLPGCSGQNADVSTTTTATASKEIDKPNYADTQPDAAANHQGISPADAIKQFYQAAINNDCKTALSLRPNDYSEIQCKNLTQATIHSLATRQLNTRQSEVILDITQVSDNISERFTGIARLEKQNKGWIMTTFEKNSKAAESISNPNPPQHQATHTPPVTSDKDIIGADPLPTLTRLQARYPQFTRIALVDVSQQTLSIFQDADKIAEYPVSTATNGIGSQSGSGKTPLGAHRISQKFGDGALPGTIFKARQNTGVIAKIIKEKKDVPEDHVTTRILWLDGLESGKNKGGNVDSKSRYIYIHGTPEEGLIGQPASHGCIRMKNDNVIEVYKMLDKNTLVYIGR